MNGCDRFDLDIVLGEMRSAYDLVLLFGIILGELYAPVIHFNLTFFKEKDFERT